jgi:signal peptidase II
MRALIIFVFVLAGTFLIDQGIKRWAVDSAYIMVQANPGYSVSITEESLIGTKLIAGKCIDMELHFNRGVAFSLFAFLGPYMKWVQGSLVLLLIFLLFKENYIARYAFPAGLLIGGALGNVYDRFVHIGVVDYVAWHCGFNYAVFNYADVAIDIAFVIIVWMYFKDSKTKKSLV